LYVGLTSLASGAVRDGVLGIPSHVKALRPPPAVPLRVAAPRSGYPPPRSFPRRPRLRPLSQLARILPTPLLLSIHRQRCTQLYQLSASWHRSLLCAEEGNASFRRRVTCSRNWPCQTRTRQSGYAQRCAHRSCGTAINRNLGSIQLRSSIGCPGGGRGKHQPGIDSALSSYPRVTFTGNQHGRMIRGFVRWQTRRCVSAQWAPVQ
jgi:hypothetical protein